LLADRRAWACDTATRLNHRCMGCGRQKWNLHIHEIERRSQAPRRWCHRSNFLLLCQDCHSGEFDAMAHPRQLAHKLWWDAENYDLDAWLRLRDPELKAPLRVMSGSVTYWLDELRCKFQ